MQCSKCNAQITEGQLFCSACGTSTSDRHNSNGAPVVVIKEKSGCFKGCLIGVLLMVVGFFGLMVLIGAVTSTEENEEIVSLPPITNEEAKRNGEDLIAWIRNKDRLTDLMRDNAFAKLQGKTVILSGKVREIGKTAFTDEIYVSLTVGQISALEDLNVQFNIRESEVAKVRLWNKDEIHTLRGRISDQGDLADDAECDIGEVVE